MKKTSEVTKKISTTIPQPVLIGEAMLLHRWCSDDRKLLVKNGLDWNSVMSLPELCTACDTQYVEYTLAKAELARLRKRLAKSFRAATKVRSLIAKRIRYALDTSEIDKKIPEYSMHKAYPEIIADLREISALCIHLKDAMEKTGFKAYRAQAVCRCADLKEAEFLNYQDAKLASRDLKKRYIRVYRMVYKVVQKIRKCAFSLFPVGSERRKGYISPYRKSFY